MKQATIYDYIRMCKKYNSCVNCPLEEYCIHNIDTNLDKANEIILNWCERHPIKTRQSEFLKIYPNADIDYGFLDICPTSIDKRLSNDEKCKKMRCEECRKEYWLAEVDKHE